MTLLSVAATVVVTVTAAEEKDYKDYPDKAVVIAKEAGRAASIVHTISQPF